MEPGPAGCEGRTLPLCYADPPSKINFALFSRTVSSRNEIFNTVEVSLALD